MGLGPPDSEEATGFLMSMQAGVGSHHLLRRASRSLMMESGSPCEERCVCDELGRPQFVT